MSAEREALIQAVRAGWPEHGTRHYDVRGGMYLAPPVRDGGVTATLIDFAVDTALSQMRRTVTTVEELDALPQQTVVLDCDNDAWQKHRTTGVWSNTEGATQNSKLVSTYAPLTILREGSVDAEYHQHHGPQSTCTECEVAS